MMPRSVLREVLFVMLLVVTALGLSGTALHANDGGTTVYLPSMQWSASDSDLLGSASVEMVDVIVVMRDEVDHPGATAAEIARSHGGQLGFVYQHALKGASMSVPAQAIAGIGHNPNVKYVELDAEVSISQQTMPKGISRIYADSNSKLLINGDDDKRVDVDVAVIDTGVDFDHPDLTVAGGVNCIGLNWRKATCVAGGDDDHYHGTHVAGTIGALDNDIGVVGVAPGARIWAVKVLNSRGSGYTSWIVAGIDWVAANADTIEVANMSLGGAGYSQAEYDAIQGAVNKGVAFAVSAGNESDDAGNYSPAQFDNVLTVSALADFDGSPGGNGDPTCRTDEDDTLANFSNYGTAVDIAAPGVCILSTFPVEQGGYGTISGTSMASPHVAGALAILASKGKPINAADVDAIYGILTSSGNDVWTDESGDGAKESLLDISAEALFSPVTTDGEISAAPTPEPTSTPTPDPTATPEPSPEPTPTQNPSDEIVLTVTTAKITAIQTVILEWTGVSDVRVNRTHTELEPKSWIASGGYSEDPLGKKPSGTYTYQVCDASNPSVCSKVAQISF